MEQKVEKNKNEIIQDKKIKSKNFIPSYFNWITSEEQKKRAKELENITNPGNEVKNKGW